MPEITTRRVVIGLTIIPGGCMTIRPRAGYARLVWLGGAAFVVSLAVTFGGFYLGMGPAPAGSAAGWAALVDVLLFSGFALHHSLFARAAIKRWLPRGCPRTWSAVCTSGLRVSCSCWLLPVGSISRAASIDTTAGRPFSTGPSCLPGSG